MSDVFNQKSSVNRLLLTLLMMSLPGLSYATNPLQPGCDQAKGTVLSGYLITNYTVLSEPVLKGEDISAMTIEYNRIWFENRAGNVHGFLTMAQLAMSMHRKVDICVSSTKGNGPTDRMLLGIVFTDTF